MNEICLILEDNFYFANLNFSYEENFFYINDERFTFEIVFKNKMKINNNKYSKDMFTNDSYVYFENSPDGNFLKKINLIHNEWFDNVLLDYKNNKIIRIKDRDQFGNFKEINNILEIDWDYWGKEKFVKKDEYNYLKKDYKIIEYEKKNNVEVYIFIHVCTLNNGLDTMTDQINEIKNSGLYDRSSKIFISIVGNYDDENDKNIEDDKIKIIYKNNNPKIYEIETINKIKNFCSKINQEAYILYIHTKGANNSGNNEVIKSWRKMMEYFLIEKFEVCLEALSHYDCLGNNFINEHCYNFDEVKVNDNHTKHYSGNFWWSKKKYIDKLKYLEIDYSDKAKFTRYRAENWILSSDESKIGVIYQDYTNTHPYHRYVFENYKNNFDLIKTFN